MGRLIELDGHGAKYKTLPPSVLLEVGLGWSGLTHLFSFHNAPFHTPGITRANNAVQTDEEWTDYSVTTKMERGSLLSSINTSNSKKESAMIVLFNSWLRLSPPLKKNTHDTSAQNPGWNPKKYGRTMTQNKVPPWRFVHGYHNGPFRCPHGGGNMANHSNSRNTITVPVAENKLTQSGKYQKEEFYRKHKICVWCESFQLP